jgi:hypothetical protein
LLSNTVCHLVLLHFTFLSGDLFFHKFQIVKSFTHKSIEMETVAGYPAFSSTDLSLEEGAHWKTVVIMLIYHLLIMYLSTPIVVN